MILAENTTTGDENKFLTENQRCDKLNLQSREQATRGTELECLTRNQGCDTMKTE